MIRTAIFKLHNPSRHKLAVLHYAFKHYTVGLEAALALAKDNLDWLVEKATYNGRLSTKSLHSAIGRLFSEKKFKLPLHSSARDSMMVELEGMVGSYLGLLRSDSQQAPAGQMTSVGDLLIRILPTTSMLLEPECRTFGNHNKPRRAMKWQSKSR